jgi:hypothetical protein
MRNVLPNQDKNQVSTNTCTQRNFKKNINSEIKREMLVERNYRSQK